MTMTNEEIELYHELAGQVGDPVRCRFHGEVIRSPDGMFDGVCGGCEAEADEYPVLTPGEMMRAERCEAERKEIAAGIRDPDDYIPF